MASTIQVATMVPRTIAEGPGVRSAVWVQGCSVRCVGCFNPHLWTSSGGTAIEVDEILAMILDSGSDGVTFLGGEPFDQADVLARLAEAVRRHGLSVMTFTGYVYGNLLSLAAEGDTGVAALLAHTDLLVDGPYDLSRPDHVRPWVGSTNQTFRALSDRYAEVAAHPETFADQIEVTVSATGTTSVNGWASVDALEALLDGVGSQPPALRVRRR
jgi:anaerobic ribonucleoside-triphosphate reductase activating protein